VKYLKRDQLQAIKVPLAYFFLGSLWIVISHQVFFRFFLDSFSLLKLLVTWNSLLLVFVTTGLIYWFIQSRNRSRNLLYYLLKATNDPIFFKDKNGRYILVNQATANLIGKSSSEIIGQTDSQLLETKQASLFPDLPQNVIQSGESYQLEQTLVNNDIPITYWVTQFPRFNQRGNIIGVIGVAQNITQQKQLQEQLNASHQQIETIDTITTDAIASVTLENFLNQLLHQLRQTLQADSAMIFMEQYNELTMAAQVGDESLHESSSLNQEIARLIFNRQKCPSGRDHQPENWFSRYAVQSPYQSYILGIPLLWQNQLVGILQLQWNRSYQLTAQQQHLLEVVAVQLTITILNVRLDQQTEQLKQRLQLQFQSSPLACILQDSQGRITDWNATAEQLFGYAESEVLGETVLDVIVPHTKRGDVQDMTNRLLAGESKVDGITDTVTKSGTVLTCQWQQTLFRNNGQVMGILSMINDLTEQMELQQQLQNAAYYDPLTELPIRRYVKQQINRLLEKGDPVSQFALFHFDITAFETIQYSFGDDFANDFLMAIVQRLTSQLPQRTLLARIGIDEFAILSEQVATFQQAQYWIQRLQQWFRSPVNLGEDRIFTNLNVGLVLSSQLSGSAEAFLQAADTAMQQARFSPSETYAVFDPNFQQQARDHLRLDREMREALQQEAFQLYYQPIIDLKTREISGFEALIRWEKEGQWRSPNQFLPVAEQTGLIVALDRWVLDQACWQMQQWQSLFSNLSCYLTVNISALNLMETNFVNSVIRTLNTTSLAPQKLILEITDTALINHPEQLNRIIQQLRNKGIQFCWDNWGMGYGSVNALHSLRWDKIKIHQDLISHLETDSKSYHLIASLIQFAQKFDITVIAKGVETQQQLQKLQQLGCHQGQGFLLGKPLPSKNR